MENGSSIYDYKIGQLIQADGFPYNELKSLVRNSAETKDLEFVLQEIEKSDTTKIAQINKRISIIIIIIIISLSLIIILFIIKSID